MIFEILWSKSAIKMFHNYGPLRELWNKCNFTTKWTRKDIRIRGRIYTPGPLPPRVCQKGLLSRSKIAPCVFPFVWVMWVTKKNYRSLLQLFQLAPAIYYKPKKLYRRYYEKQQNGLISVIWPPIKKIRTLYFLQL